MKPQASLLTILRLSCFNGVDASRIRKFRQRRYGEMRHTRYALTALGAISALIGTALLSACGGGGLSGLNGNNENAGNTTQFGSLSVQLIGATPVSAAGPEATITGAAGTLSGANLYDHKGKIAFSVYDGSQWDIYLINDDGTGLVNLTPNTGGSSELWPNFSPDGRRIAYGVNNGSLIVANADGSNPRTIYTVGSYGDILATFTPDGTQIAFWIWQDASGRDIYLINADGSNLTNLTPNTGDSREASPYFHQSGKLMIFVSNRKATITDSLNDHDLYLMWFDGSTRRTMRIENLSDIDGANAWDETFASFAPDFQFNPTTGIGEGEIVFARRAPSAQPFWSGQHGIYRATIRTIDADNDGKADRAEVVGTPQLVYDDPLHDDQYPYYSPDGSKIVFSNRIPYGVANQNIPGRKGLWIINRDGSNLVNLVSFPSSGDSNQEFKNSNWVARGVTPLVGAAGVLGQSAGGFLYGETSEGPVSFLVFDVENPANRGSLRLQLLTGQSNAGVHVFNITGTSSAPIKRMEYIDLTVKTAFSGEQGIKQRLIGGDNPVFAQSAQAVLVSMSGKTGKLTSVMPYQLSRSAPQASVQGNVQVLRGEFLGVYDPETGKNLAPNGAREVHIDLQTGAVLKVQ